jgi:hypothetical protein
MSIYQQIEEKYIFYYINDLIAGQRNMYQGIIVHMYMLNDHPIITMMKDIVGHMIGFYYQQTNLNDHNNLHIYQYCYQHIKMVM